MASLRHDEGCYEKYIFTRALVRNGLSNDGAGVARSSRVRQEIRPGAGFETGELIKRNWGGLTP